MNASAAALLVSTAPVKRMKGVGFVNVRTFVQKDYGDEAWAAVLGRLGREEREQVAHALAVGWYPTLLFARLLRMVDLECGRGDFNLLRRVGAAEAEQDFNRVYRVFLRTLKPAAFFAAEARLWKHFQDSGSWRWHSIPGGMEATLEGWEADEALCIELAGYLAKVIEFTGGKHVRVDHPACVCRGYPGCTFMLRWT